MFISIGSLLDDLPRITYHVHDLPYHVSLAWCGNPSMWQVPQLEALMSTVSMDGVEKVSSACFNARARGGRGGGGGGGGGACIIGNVSYRVCVCITKRVAGAHSLSHTHPPHLPSHPGRSPLAQPERPARRARKRPARSRHPTKEDTRRVMQSTQSSSK